MTRTQRLVVLRALGLGDLCTAVPALRALRRAFWDLEMVVMAPYWQRPILEVVGADRVVDVRSLDRELPRIGDVDLAVNLHGSGPRSTDLLRALDPARLLAFRRGSFHRGLLDPGAFVGGSRSPTWVDHEHDRLRWCLLLRHWSIDADPADLRLPRPDPGDHVGHVVVHPGAASAARRWPADRFAEVVRMMRRRGRDVVLTGVGSERPLCRQVLDLCRGIEHRGSLSDLAGRTSIEQLAATIAHARLVISNDTGVAHLASAYGVPSVVLFGPTPPSEWGPPDGPHRALWAGRSGDPHGTTVDPGLLDITVDQVIAAASSLDGSAGRSTVNDVDDDLRP